MQDLSLHVLDLAENGVNAGANRIIIEIEEDESADTLTVIIKDNGKGMSPEFLAKALDPFVTTRTTRKVGLGLSLFQQACREAEGDLIIRSQKGLGTEIVGWMKHSHIDRKPLGNMVETMIALIMGNPEIDFTYKHKRNGAVFVLDTEEIRKELEDVPINSPGVIAFIREYLVSGFRELTWD